MNFWMSLSIVVVLLLLFFVWRKRKKRRKDLYAGGEKHPNGFVKYHKNTKLRIRKALVSTKSQNNEQKSIALLKFHGDIRATSRWTLARCIDEVLLNKEEISECVLLVESPGGGVMEYGHAFSEVKRIRDSGMTLTVCVDTVAASGGYLMSLPAHKILAAPFAMVGSIGVMSFIPNVRKLLQKLNIEPRTFTSGQFKRTVTLTDDASPEETAHYKEQLQLIHDQFKSALKQYRPEAILEQVATGDAWLAQSSFEKNLKLVDALSTSSDYLLSKNKETDIIEIYEETKKSGWKRMFEKATSRSLELLSKLLEKETLTHLS